MYTNDVTKNWGQLGKNQGYTDTFNSKAFYYYQCPLII
jgi:hypothetical protein